MIFRAQLFGALAFAPAMSLAAVDYLGQVKPILTQHCVRCHGADDPKAGFRADTAAGMREGGDSGLPPLRQRPGEESLLVQLIAGGHEDIPQMPYKKPPLDPAQVAVLRAWVAEGAPAPDQEEPGKFQHWAFTTPARVAPPAVQRRDWPRNAIDRFVLARLEHDRIAPSPPADRRVLLRRVTLDLIGLPPTPEEIDAFLQDRRADAYERVVERLLASPHFGERWARPWLDVARYGDSDGYSIDAPRQIWKYRDWVVAALNRDLPFDQFVIEQLAGDLLPEATIEQKIATGFNRNTQINKEGGIDPEQYRIESVMDRVNTFGAAFLGLTVGCAQCHDHKFDPIKQREYYQLFAFFNNSVDDGHGMGRAVGGTLSFPKELQRNADQERELAAARQELGGYLDAQTTAFEKWRDGLAPDARELLRPAIRASLELAWSAQSFAQKRASYTIFGAEDAEFQTRNKQLTQLEKEQAKPPSTLVMAELPNPRESFVFINGDFTRPGEKVLPGTPAILPPLATTKPNRLDLARWVVHPANPLAARVLVNRIWQQYFGRGLVETENDFGTQGSEPTHPELLDWLATELIAQKWSMKAIHRAIVSSATYRQASQQRPDLEIADPTNKLLARQPRLRLDAEIIRDVALAASGLLVPELGGPPVYPPQPDGVMTLGQVKREWKASAGPDRYRRGLYTHLWRATPHPALTVFDGPDGFSACTRRLRSNTPLQALTLLNDRQFVEFAEALARRVQAEAQDELPAQIDFAFRVCVARPPRPAERQRLIALFREQHAVAVGNESARKNEAWITLARVFLNLDETITRE
ncbi:MAG: hypothetical protein RIQ93_336, partial [Verrucomicrobiota bacterium]